MDKLCFFIDTSFVPQITGGILNEFVEYINNFGLQNDAMRK